MDEELDELAGCRGIMSGLILLALAIGVVLAILWFKP